MDSATTGRVASELGTTRSRVLRAAAAGVVHPASSPGGHLRFTPEEVAVLRHHLGFAPRVRGFTREEVRVLTVLARHPLGLRSARAVARSAGISVTTASRTLGHLSEKRLVYRRRQRVVAGAVTDVDLWHANVRHPRWRRLAPLLAATVLPDGPAQPASDERAVPRWLRHLFWNADIGELDVERDASYIADRVLASEDAQAHAWVVSALVADAFEAAARVRGVSGRRAALARNVAAAS